MLDKKKFYINGEWVLPKKSNDFKVTDPSTEEECATISLGGDHTIAVPLLRAINKKCKGPVSLVHFDAHLDTWDTYFGAPSTHGTPFRRAREEGLFLDDASMHVGIRGPL